ncbi:MAG: hypothetical protein ACFFDW_16790 [Candidatus Thorarchaeota archaeon]
MSKNNNNNTTTIQKKTTENHLNEMFNCKDDDISNNSAILFEQYKLYVEMADRTSARRAATNNFFLTANSFIFVALGVLVSNDFLILSPVVLVVGVFFCMSWLLLIQYYKSLNSSKYKVINEIEKRLPVMGFFCEYNIIKQAKGKFGKRLTNIERWIPISLLIMYSSGIIANIVYLIVIQ